jgi:hypothetical protein
MLADASLVDLLLDAFEQLACLGLDDAVLEQLVVREMHYWRQQFLLMLEVVGVATRH